MRLLHQATRIVRRLRDAGFEAYFAGGCVRDMLMGRPAKDVDIATSARPEQVQGLFAHSRAFGKAFGVIQVQEGDETFEIATFRKDLGYTDGRRPNAVHFTHASEDAARRDFTINGMFYDPVTERVIDFVGGQADLAARVLRTIGAPGDRFGEDYLRMLRAVRFASVLEFRLADETLTAIQRLSGHITTISAERIQQEITRLLLESPKAGEGLRLLQRSGLLERILPEVSAMIGVEQPPQYHPEGDVFTHTALMLDLMQERDAALAYAVLLHDVAKPVTFRRAVEDDGTERIRFDQHDKIGADMAAHILERLRLPRELIAAVSHCVRGHMRFMHVQEMRRATLRHLIGSPTFATELELHRLDCLGSHRALDNYHFLVAQREAFRAEPVLPAPWIDGRDIMGLGVPEGRQVGAWRQAAYQRQLEGQAADRDELLAWLRGELAKIHRAPGK